MKKNVFSFYACIFFYMVSAFTPSYSQAQYSDPLKILPLGSYIDLLVDKENTLTFEQVQHSEKFESNTRSVPNPGIVPDYTVWARFSVLNRSNIENLLLQVDQPTIDEIEFYQFDYILQKYHVLKMGEFQMFSLRRYLTPDYLFDVHIPKGQTRIFYLKIRCKENMQLPIFIGTSTAIFNQSVVKNIISGIYIGIMLVMMLYNLFIYFSIKDKSYLYYALYIIIILLTQTNLQGYPFQFLWPNHSWIAIHGSFLFPALVGLAALEFFKEFLRIKERTPKMYTISLILIIPYCISIILSIIGLYSIGYQIMEINAGVVSIFMLISSFMIYRMGNREARFFLLGWSIFLVGICIYILKDFDILPYNNFTRYTMHFGSGIEVILLSFALADKINILKKEKELSQAEVLIALKENEKLITEQNIVLEQKVEERTQALNTTNKELNTTLKDLKDTQAQLVDAEKMASLGQLTAGIAHEINNPINFVSANVKPLSLDIDDLMLLIQKYESITNSDTLEEKLKEIAQYKKQIDYEYIQQEIKTLLEGIGDGAKRTAEIVKGLRNFSRLDESEIKLADLNEGIESTLIILRSEMPANIQLIKNLGGISPIECYPGKLNQVFMNAINNSIHAMKKNTALQHHTLTISTYMLEQSVCVSFEDTGIGMSDNVIARIFEPFFTTKDVGEGTGLGMSIVFKIIESHGGNIDIESEVGKGTKIIFTLPKKITI